jgi:peptide/nickel transport system permease protein
MSGFEPVAMQSNAVPPGGTAPLQPRQSGKGFWQRALRHRSFMAGGVLTLFAISAALLSMVWTPWPAYEIDIAHKLNPPSASHWIGHQP